MSRAVGPPRICILCLRPLPRLSWAQRLPLIGWLLEPPPFHIGAGFDACQRAFERRVEAMVGGDE